MIAAIFFSTLTLIVTLICYLWCFFGYYTSEWQGQAQYNYAVHERKIKILEAEATKESAVYLAHAEVEKAKSLAEAEIIRASGVAEANRIIGESLTGNEAYLRYRWIEGLQTNQMQVIYVPTEANLPLLEAQRFGNYQNP